MWFPPAIRAASGDGLKGTVRNPENPLESIANAMAFSVSDWSLEKRDAWIYGIVLGWDDAAMKEMQQKFGWPDSECQRLNRMHERFVVMQEAE